MSTETKGSSILTYVFVAIGLSILWYVAIIYTIDRAKHSADRQFICSNGYLYTNVANESFPIFIKMNDIDIPVECQGEPQ